MFKRYPARDLDYKMYIEHPELLPALQIDHIRWFGQSRIVREYAILEQDFTVKESIGTGGLQYLRLEDKGIEVEFK